MNHLFLVLSGGPVPILRFSQSCSSFKSIIELFNVSTELVILKQISRPIVLRLRSVQISSLVG